MTDPRIPGDDALDGFLAAAFDEPPLREREFTSALSERLRRHRQRRRWAMGAAAALGTGATAVALSLSPAPFEAEWLVSPEGIVLALVLTALCSLVWIGAEARTTIRPAARAQ